MKLAPIPKQSGTGCNAKRQSKKSERSTAVRAVSFDDPDFSV